MSMTPRHNARQRILDAVADLFYREGYQAVGVDRIVQETGVTKMTLYRHFPSKDDLIVTYLHESNAKFWEWIETTLKPYENSPYDQLVAFFEAVAQMSNAPGCHGCTFQNTAVELPALEHPGHRVALDHKQAVLDRLNDLAVAAGAREPEILANQLFLLMDGAWIAKRMFGPTNPAQDLVSAARVLIDAQLRPPATDRQSVATKGVQPWIPKL
ncbi:MAG: TetR/AcrR family transcriptional regulator [Chloroflexi bacterium]|nr:TetR/AcrR family transcriptional regulator [Chloroflexota bacterium]